MRRHALFGHPGRDGQGYLSSGRPLGATRVSHNKGRGLHRGHIVAQQDGVPVYWGYPTTEWEVGEVVPDRIRLAIGAQTPPGTYRLLAGMYDERTGQRLPLTVNGERQKDDQLELALITIEGKGPSPR